MHHKNCFKKCGWRTFRKNEKKKYIYFILEKVESWDFDHSHFCCLVHKLICSWSSRTGSHLVARCVQRQLFFLLFSSSEQSWKLEKPISFSIWWLIQMFVRWKIWKFSLSDGWFFHVRSSIIPGRNSAVPSTPATIHCESWGFHWFSMSIDITIQYYPLVCCQTKNDRSNWRPGDGRNSPVGASNAPRKGVWEVLCCWKPGDRTMIPGWMVDRILGVCNIFPCLRCDHLPSGSIWMAKNHQWEGLWAIASWLSSYGSRSENKKNSNHWVLGQSWGDLWRWLIAYQASKVHDFVQTP